MRLQMLVLGVVAGLGLCVCAAPGACAQEQTKKPAWEHLGTIVALGEAAEVAGEQTVRFSLRLDEPVQLPDMTAKAGAVLHFACDKSLLRGVGLGDQVRVGYSSGVLGQLTSVAPLWLAESVTRLGRGEFLNPAAKASVDLGSPDAKVLVKMFAPLGIACHQATVDLLKQLAGEEPQRLRVQLFDMHVPAMVAEVNRERLSCATVLVNNRYQFTIREGGKERKVEMTHRPNAERSTYNSEDVPVVVRQEIARIYGPAPPKMESKP